MVRNPFMHIEPHSPAKGGGKVHALLPVVHVGFEVGDGHCWFSLDSILIRVLRPCYSICDPRGGVGPRPTLPPRNEPNLGECVLGKAGFSPPPCHLSPGSPPKHIHSRTVYKLRAAHAACPWALAESSHLPSRPRHRPLLDHCHKV